MSAICGICTFLILYGFRPLNPTYVGWILNGGDMNQSYLGWKAVRNSVQSFPFLMQDRLAYPHRISIMFTDSIPLFALLFRPFSALLPSDFQYFGIWGLICFLLQAVFTARILRSYTDNPFLTILGCLLLNLMPSMLFRMFVHNALAGQWILLFALLPLFDPRGYEKNGMALYRHVFLMGLLSALLHLYLTFMCAFIWLGIVFYDFWIKKSLKRVLLLAGCFALPVFVVVGTLGGFSSHMQAKSFGLGSYSFNLNGYFNPQGWSDLLPDQPLYLADQYEGFSYLGLGFLCLSAAGIVAVVLTKKGRMAIKENVARVTAVLIIFTSSLIAAASPVVTFGDRLLMDLRLPEAVLNIWGIVRASGRLAWVGGYLIVLCAMVAIGKLCDKRVASVFLCLVLLLQTYDLHTMLEQRHDRYKESVAYSSPLDAYEFWDEMAENDRITHIMLTDFSPFYSELFVFGNWALSHQKTLNTFYFSRPLTDDVGDISGDYPEDSLYVFFDRNCLECTAHPLHYYRVGEYIVGYVHELEGYEPYDPVTASLEWSFGDGQNLSENGGVDTEEGRLLYPEGFSYGPYWNVPAGEWSVVLEGENLEDLTIEVYSNGGQTRYDPTVSVEDGHLCIRLSLEQKADGLEIVLRNTGKENVTLTRMQLSGS